MAALVDQTLPDDFDPTSYLEANPDVAQAGIDPIQHYLEIGRLENRRLFPDDFNVRRSLKIADLLKQSIGMQDFSRLIHICHYAMETEALEGDIVEFGCHEGHTAKLLSSISKKTVHVYDSFEGLPLSSEACPGDMKTSLDSLTENFAKDNVRMPVITAGWFSDLSIDAIPEKIAFAHLDGDAYISIRDSLKLIYHRLVPGAIILIDDYDSPTYFGVKAAVTEFFADKEERVKVLNGLGGKPAYKAMVRRL